MLDLTARKARAKKVLGILKHNACVPRADWVAVAHLLIEHGRLTCRARAPRCDACPLFPHCETRA